MKDIKKIRELYDLVTEAEEKESRKLTALVRAGLFDAKKLPALKRALDKNADKMTAAEKRMLINLLDSLMAEVLGSQSVYTKVKQNVQHEKLDEANKAIGGQGYLSKYDPRGEKGYPKQEDMPAVIVLKRKAIRVYPDNTKVALYYSQALDKYVSIPFGETGVSNMNEQTAGAGPNQKFNMPGKKKKTQKKSRTSASDEMRSHAADMLKYNRGYEKQKGLANKTGYLMKSGMHPVTAFVVAASGVGNAQKERVKKTVARARARTDIKENAVTENFSHKLQMIREEYSKKDMAYDAADIATDLIPGVSNVKSAYSAAKNLKAGNYGSAALDAALAIPGVGNVGKWIGAGVKSIRFGKKAISAGEKVAADAPKLISKSTKAADTAVDAAPTTVKTIKPKQNGPDFGKETEILPPTKSSSSPSSSSVSTKTAEKPSIKLPDLEPSSSKNLPAVKSEPKLPATKPETKNLPAVKTEPKTATQTKTDVATKVDTKTATATKGSGRLKLARRAAIGMGLAAAAKGMLGGGSGDNENEFTKGNYNFTMKPKTSRASEFDPLKATHKRDETSNRKLINQPMNESPFEVIRKTVAENLEESTVFFGDKQITINNSVANKINNLYESMNKSNKKVMEKMINESASSFSKVLTFSVRY